MAFEKAEGDTSAWNQFFQYVETLNIISREIDNATLSKNYTLKYELLRRLYAKLHPLMNQKDRENHEDYVIKCEEAYKNILTAQQAKKRNIKQEWVDWLDIWEIELMDLWHKRVPFVPSKSDPNFAMMSGSY